MESETILQMDQAPTPVAPEYRIMLTQAVAVALQNNPQIVEAQHQTAGARDNLVGQSAPLNPTLAYSGLNNSVGSINPADPGNYSIYFTLETSGRQRLRTNQARAQFHGAEYDAQATRLAVRQGAASAYITLQVANSAFDNEQEAYRTAIQLRDLTQKQFELGAAPETNAIRASVAFTQEEQNLYTAVSNVMTARANLNVQLGRDPAMPIDAVEPLKFTPISLHLTALQQKALEARPEIRAAEASRQALQAAVGLQRSQYYPDVLLGTDLRARELEVGVTLPLLDFGSIHGAVGQAKEAVKAQQAQQAQVRQSALLDVQTAYLTLIAAQHTVEAFQNGILPRTQSLLNKVEQGYKLGASTILDLIDAQETLRTTRNDYYNAIGSHQQALAQLDRAVGAPFDDAHPLGSTGK